MPSVGYATLQVIPSVRGISDELRRQLVGPAGDAGGDAGQAAGEGLRDKVKMGAAAAGAAAGALLVAGIAEAIDQMNITSTLQAQLGATGKDAARYGKLAGQLYAKGITTDVQQGADTIRAVINAGLAPPDATNKQLTSIATKMADVANTFGTDMSMQTQAVSAMMKNGLAPNASAALDVITVGMQKLGPNAEDLLETFQEYPVQLRKLGIDSKMALGLFRQGLQGGARDTDIVADSLKEFSIRAIDMSTGSVDAYKALGLNAETMSLQIAKGGKGANDGLQLVLDRLREMKDPVAREAAAVGLFGTQAEELGSALFKLDPGKAAAGFGKVSGAAGKLGDVLHSGPAHEIEVFSRALKQGFVDLVGGQVLPVLGDMARWFSANLLPPIRAVASVVGALLVPALTGLFSAGAAVVGWLRDMGTWLIPIGVLVGGITLMLTANAIATTAVTAAFSLYRGAILAWTAVQRTAIVIQTAWNTVMALNPIGLVVIALIALGAALVVAYKKSETFRGIVQGAWEGIKTVALWVWNNALKPAIDGLVAGWKMVSAGAVWLWGVLKPVFSFIGTAFKVLAAVWAVVMFGPMYLGFKVLGAVALWLWDKAISPVIDWIIAGFKLWWAGVKVYFAFVQAAFKAVAAVALWLWRSVIKPVIGWIVAGFKLWWAGVKVYFKAVRTYILGPLASVFRWLYSNVIKPVWDRIKSVISGVWNRGIRPAFDALKKAVGKVGDAFGRARDAIGRAWEKIKNLTKKPINWVIRVVWNEGIVGIWKKIGGWIPGLPKLNKLPLLAAGGPMPVQPGVFNRPTAIVGEGNPRHPEYVIPTDPKYRRRALALHQAAGSQLLADGGVIGKIRGAIGSAAGFFSDPLKSLGKLLSPLLDKLKHVTGSPWGKLAAGLPRAAIGGLKKLVKDKVGGLFGGGGGSIPGGSGVQRWAGVVRQALALVGQPLAYTGTTLRRMNQESGGNPRAVNLWDINAKLGHPSVGLMQVIRPTYQAYAGSLRKRGPFMYGVSIDPLSNVYSSMRYALSRYGSLPRAYNRAGGYDEGGWLMPGYTAAFNGTGRPEAVLTEPQWRAVEAGLRGGDSPTVTYQINARTADFTVRDLQRVQRVQEARARVGRPR